MDITHHMDITDTGDITDNDLQMYITQQNQRDYKTQIMQLLGFTGVIEHTVTLTTKVIFFVVSRIVATMGVTDVNTTILHLLQDIYTPVYVCVCVCGCVCVWVYIPSQFLQFCYKNLYSPRKIRDSQCNKKHLPLQYLAQKWCFFCSIWVKSGGSVIY